MPTVTNEPRASVEKLTNAAAKAKAPRKGASSSAKRATARKRKG